MSIEKVVYIARAKAMGERVGNQMLGHSYMEAILKGLDGGILKIELNLTQSVLMKIRVALVQRGSYGGRHAGNSF